MKNYGKRMLLYLGVMLFLTGCADPDAAIPEDEDVIVEEDVYKDGDRVYRRFSRTVFEDIEAMVTTEVPVEDFWAYYSEAESRGEAVNCVWRTEIVDERTSSIGLFYPGENGKMEKICTFEDCRRDEDLPCEHLSSPSEFTGSCIWYNDCMYYIGTYWVHGTRDITYYKSSHNYMVLRWQKGSDHFEKVFDSMYGITELSVSGGILYLRAMEWDGTQMYYALNLDELVYTVLPIPQDAMLWFGENHIVMYDRSVPETCLVNAMLTPVFGFDDYIWDGQVVGDEFWYTVTGEKAYHKELYRVNLLKKSAPVPVLENADKFAVCGDMLFWRPWNDETAEVLFEYRDEDSPDTVSGLLGKPNTRIMRARIFKNGTLGTPEIVMTAANQEWVIGMNPCGYLGEYCAFTTITPGNMENVEYYTHTYIADWQKKYEISVKSSPQG
ncbi:MAG: hypothetical protein IJ037_08735 [Clostridia bacterium]|nr:hypothetical protein [Clostridia bacterium]